MPSQGDKRLKASGGNRAQGEHLESFCCVALFPNFCRLPEDSGCIYLSKAGPVPRVAIQVSEPELHRASEKPVAPWCN